MSRIAAHMLLFFFGKFCTPICLIQAYAFINFQKNCKNIVLKIRFYTNPYASIQNFSTLCLYDFFEIASSMLLFPTMPQYETLEYLDRTFILAHSHIDHFCKSLPADICCVTINFLVTLLLPHFGLETRSTKVKEIWETNYF